ncbi:methyltransferase FkbM [Thioclava dalianensis]|uniref:Methyltransferase FkbM n=2 Tax=Thioclava dalianensis TaxID=1185766 RepID=A0A074U091_9RHOB|nr:FkbM family methyltransferase [Thioclava dalianensis]KEP68112.1 methyltransferase FkbM [Thioclava dalianensis]SFN38953.1 methyltransferase, FkbM family [Thioclava dalianensis]
MAISPSSRAKARAGLAKSLAVYYRDTTRRARMDHLHAQFVPRGGLCFDIGAHVGDRTASFASLGARVVALEPQPRMYRALRLIHRNTPGVRLLNQAVGAREGRMVLHLNTANPTVASLSEAFVQAAASTDGWRQERWDAQIEVEVTTLDALIAEYGKPDFVKIDVEGFEADVFEGLSSALPALSFEFTTLQRDVARSGLARLAQLGRYICNLSLGETHRLELAQWISSEKMAAHIDALPDAVNSGDIFVRRA